MNMLEKILACGLALTVGFGVVGCDDEEGECNEAGVCTDGGAGGAGGAGGEGGFGGEGGAGGGAELSFTHVILTDTSADENGAGTPGVDICSVVSSCGTPVEAQLILGGGTLCEEVGDDCSADRTDPTAALSVEMECEPVSAPSHYVSTGMGGQLIVIFGETQAGCDLTINELAGNDDESASVMVCTGVEQDDDCLTTADGSTDLITGASGEFSVSVPEYVAE